MGFASESRERARPVIPLAGMVDVLFLLLIFFMSTYSMREQEMMVDIGLPVSETAEPGTTRAQKVVVSFDEEGRVYLGQRLVQVADLATEMTKLAEINPDQPVIVRGAGEADYALFMKVVDAATQAGLGEVRAATLGEEE